MIAYIRGTVLRTLPTGVVLDVQGIGYELNLSLKGVGNLPSQGGAVAYWVYTRVREDEISLYGFEAQQEHAAFARAGTGEWRRA